MPSGIKLCVAAFSVLVATVSGVPVVSGAGGPTDGQQLTGSPAALSTYTSRGWSGYFTTGPNNNTGFHSIHAQWVQPAVKCPLLDNQWALFWVGLDGYWDHVVEQGGTQAHCYLGVATDYSLWWEMYPHNIPQSGASVAPGDTIDGTVTYEDGNGTFDIVIKDLTNGHSLSVNEPCTSDMNGCVRTTAEAVTEAPLLLVGSTDHYALPNYGKTTYQSVSVTDDQGHTGPLTSQYWNTGQVSEVGAAGTPMQTTSALDPTGASFTTTWVSSR